MARPLIYGIGKAVLATAAGKTARYGAKKLAKALIKRNTKKVKKPQITRKNPDFNSGPKGGNVKDKRVLRKFVNQENKMLAKMKKGPQENIEMFLQRRTNIENILSDNIKNVLKHKNK